VITLTGVNKWFGQFHVLSDINLDVKEGEKIVDLRAVRLGQVDPDPLHQPAGGAPGRRHRGRRRELSNDVKNIEAIRRESAWCSSRSTSSRTSPSSTT
jgi:ABC-type polar amino acid transport system, ATPase component